MKDTDEIMIKGQRVSCHLGVPAEERAASQEILVHTGLSPFSNDTPLNDDVSRTINYHEVSILIDRVATERPRRLIETLAEELADAVLKTFPVCRVSIEIEKFILSNTRSVGIRITRHAEDE